LKAYKEGYYIIYALKAFYFYDDALREGYLWTGETRIFCLYSSSQRRWRAATVGAQA